MSSFSCTMRFHCSRNLIDRQLLGTGSLLDHGRHQVISTITRDTLLSTSILCYVDGAEHVMHGRHVRGHKRLLVAVFSCYLVSQVIVFPLVLQTNCVPFVFHVHVQAAGL